MEGNQGEGVQVHIVLQLLRGGVVPVVLRPLPGGRHAATNTISVLLNGAIKKEEKKKEGRKSGKSANGKGRRK